MSVNESEQKPDVREGIVHTAIPADEVARLSDDIIAALKTSLASATDAKSARQATIDAIGKVSFDGATGKVGFDEFGDSVSRVLTVYKVTGGAWKAEKTGELQ